jgi:hypothetical protein
VSNLKRAFTVGMNIFSFSVIPSEDAHQSEYVADGDKRRQWISG